MHNHIEQLTKRLPEGYQPAATALRPFIDWNTRSGFLNSENQVI